MNSNPALPPANEESPTQPPKQLPPPLDERELQPRPPSIGLHSVLGSGGSSRHRAANPTPAPPQTEKSTGNDPETT